MKNFKRNRKIRWRNPEIEFKIWELKDLLIFGTIKLLSQYIRRHEMNYDFCDDCDQKYMNCVCEGDSIHADDPPNYVYGACRDCKQNRCICDYNLKDKEDVAKFAWDLIKRKNDYDFERILDDLAKYAKHSKLETKLANKIYKFAYGKYGRIYSLDKIREIN